MLRVWERHYKESNCNVPIMAALKVGHYVEAASQFKKACAGNCSSVQTRSQYCMHSCRTAAFRSCQLFAGTRSPLIRARTLVDCAEVKWIIGDKEASLRHYAAALRICRHQGAEDLEGMILAGAGFCLLKMGRVDEAVTKLQRCEAIARRTRSPSAIAVAIHLLSVAKSKLREMCAVDSGFKFNPTASQRQNLHSRRRSLTKKVCLRRKQKKGRKRK